MVETQKEIEGRANVTPRVWAQTIGTDEECASHAHFSKRHGASSLKVRFTNDSFQLKVLFSIHSNKKNLEWNCCTTSHEPMDWPAPARSLQNITLQCKWDKSAYFLWKCSCKRLDRCEGLSAVRKHWRVKNAALRKGIVTNRCLLRALACKKFSPSKRNSDQSLPPYGRRNP